MSANIVQGIHHLKMAKEHFEVLLIEHPKAAICREVKMIIKNRINGAINALITHPHMPMNVKVGIKQEFESDAFSVPAIQEKISLLNPQQREVIENIIESILKGETITYERLS